jgi:hypothetical protein
MSSACEGHSGRKGESARRQVVRALHAWDAEAFWRTVARRSPALDVVLPALTHAADHSLLWVVIGARMMATGRRRAHRAARRGLASVAVTSVPTNDSFPFRQAASAAAFAVGAGLAEPVLALPLAPGSRRPWPTLASTPVRATRATS